MSEFSNHGFLPFPEMSLFSNHKYLLYNRCDNNHVRLPAEEKQVALESVSYTIRIENCEPYRAS